MGDLGLDAKPPGGIGVMRKLLHYASPDRHISPSIFPLRQDEYRAVANYIPENLDTDVYCFVCDENAARIDYEPSSWRALARAVHDKQVRATTPALRALPVLWRMSCKK